MNPSRSRSILQGPLPYLSVLLFLALIITPLTARAAGPVTTRETTGAPVAMVPSQLARLTMTPRTAVEVPLGYAIDKKTLRALKRGPARAPKGGVAPTLRRDPNAKAAAALAPNLVTGFEGRDNGSQPDGFLHRPDPTMAAGPNHVLTAVNSTIDIYDKRGTLLMSSSLGAWFASVSPPGGPFDPKVVYDAQAGHWMIIALASDFTSKAVYLLSVSQTSDPTGPWWNYSINSVSTFGSNAWGDYEGIGFDGNPTGSVYISSNQFSFSAGSFTTAQVVAISKTELYTGAPLTLFKTVNLKNANGSMAFSIRPARSLSATSTEYMINSQSGGGSKVTLWNVTHSFPSPPVITRQSAVNIGAYSPAPNARQKGCIDTLDTIDNRIFNAVFKGGRLYAGFNEAKNWGSGTVAAMRFLAIDTTTNTAVVNETYGQDGVYYWFPEVTVDGSGNIVSVFARSSSTEYAGIYYTGRLATDTATQPSALLKAGQACITGSRWGDYFGISVDPVDNANVWVFGEWSKNVAGVNSIWDWGTWVGEVSFGAAPPPAVSLRLTPDLSSVARGSTIGYQISATNTAATTQCVDYWEDVVLPNGSTYPASGALFGPVNVCIPAGATKNVHMTQGVPMAAPVGSYVYQGHLGAAYPAADTNASFNFSVTAFGPLAGTQGTGAWRPVENGFRR